MLQRLWLDRAGAATRPSAASSRAAGSACGSASCARTPSTCPAACRTTSGPGRDADRRSATRSACSRPADDDAPLPPYVVPGRAGGAGAVQRLGGPADVRPGLGRPGAPLAAPRGDFDVLHVHEPLTPSLSLLAVLVRPGPGGGHVPHRDDPVPGACRRARACCSSCWRGSPPGSRSARWPARCRSSTSAAARGDPQRGGRGPVRRRRAAAGLAGRAAARSASSAGSPSRARASRSCCDAFAALAPRPARACGCWSPARATPTR